MWPMTPDPPDGPAAARALVLDTNIVLDLLLFQDPASTPLQAALCGGALHWLSTEPMREELARVLDYPPLRKSLSWHQLDSAQVLARYDALAHRAAAASKACVTCKDADDQKFIDLAVQHRALLLSKDRAVLCMKKRLLALGVQALTAL